MRLDLAGLSRRAHAARCPPAEEPTEEVTREAVDAARAVVAAAAEDVRG